MGLACLLSLAPTSAAEKKAKAVSDREFVLIASASGLAEVNLSLLAKTKGSSDDVKHFAQHMITDHSKANKELLAVADKKRIPVALAMDAEHQAVETKLTGLSGAAFDKEYARVMLKDHQKAVALFASESKNGQDEDLKSWAGKTLPTLREHLKMARSLAGDHGGKGGGKQRTDR